MQGGPKLRSVVAACAAALFRTAAKTVPSWPEWIRQMEIAAKAHLPLQSIGTGKLCPDFWDSASIAQNLQGAFQGFAADRKLATAGKAILQYYLDKNHGRHPRPGDRIFREDHPLQKEVYKMIMENLFPDIERIPVECLGSG